MSNLNQVQQKAKDNSYNIELKVKCGVCYSIILLMK